MKRTKFGIIFCRIVFFGALLICLLDLFGIILLDSIENGINFIIMLITGIYLVGFED